MSNVLSPARRVVLAAGAAGAVVATGAVPAHAFGGGGSLVEPGGTFNVRQLLAPGTGPVGQLGLDQLPVVGTLPSMLDGLPVKVIPQAVPSLLKSPAPRMRTDAVAPEPQEPQSAGLGILPLMAHVPLVDQSKSQAFLQGLVGNSLQALGPLGALTGGLGGLAAF